MLAGRANKRLKSRQGTVVAAGCLSGWGSGQSSGWQGRLKASPDTAKGAGHLDEVRTSDMTNYDLS